MFAFLLIACVSRGHHEVVVMQLDATRMALSAQQVAARDDEAARDATIAALKEEIHARQAQLDLLAGKHASHEADLEALRATYAALVAEDLAEELPEAPKVPRPKPPVIQIIPRDRPVLRASVAEMTAALELAARDSFDAKRSDERHARVVAAFAPLVTSGFAVVERRGDASVVVLLAAKLFNENTVELSPRGEDVAKGAALAMEQLHGWDLEVQGHTDATPFHSSDLPSNWELGFARGVLLLRALREAGVDEPAHVTSFADTVPRAPVSDAEAARQNARVELWLSEIPGIEVRFQPTPPAPDAPSPTVPAAPTP